MCHLWHEHMACSGGHLVRMFEPSLVLLAEVVCLNLPTRGRFERGGREGRENYQDACTWSVNRT